MAGIGRFSNNRERKSRHQVWFRKGIISPRPSYLRSPQSGQSGLRLPPGTVSVSLTQSNRLTRSAQCPSGPRKPVRRCSNSLTAIAASSVVNVTTAGLGLPMWLTTTGVASYTDLYFWRPASTYDLSGATTYYNYYGVTNYGTSAATQIGQVESILTNSASSTMDTLVTLFIWLSQQLKSENRNQAKMCEAIEEMAR